MKAWVIAVMLASASAAVACGSSATSSVSGGGGAAPTSSASTSSATSTAPSGGGGNGQVTLSGSVTGAVTGSTQCSVVLNNVHSLSFAGTAQDGSSVRITATDEQGGKAVLTVPGRNLVFQGTGKLAVDATSATFTGAVFEVYGAPGTVTVDGKITC